MVWSLDRSLDTTDNHSSSVRSTVETVVMLAWCIGRCGGEVMLGKEPLFTTGVLVEEWRTWPRPRLPKNARGIKDVICTNAANGLGTCMKRKWIPMRVQRSLRCRATSMAWMAFCSPSYSPPTYEPTKMHFLKVERRRGCWERSSAFQGCI